MKIRKLLNEIALNDEIYYHGTNNKAFDHFNFENNPGKNGDFWGKGIYLTDNIEYARNFGNIILKCKIKVSNPFNLETVDPDKLNYLISNIKSTNDQKLILYFIKVKKYAAAIHELRKVLDNKFFEKQGFDSIIGPTVFNYSGNELLLFSPNQVKIIGRTT